MLPRSRWRGCLSAAAGCLTPSTSTGQDARVRYEEADC
jgi:hypothetical protein